MNDTQHPDTVEQRLRHTLHTVAETVTEDSLATATASPVAASSASLVTTKPHRRRRIALGAGAVAVPLALAAFAIVRQGPEYVDTIPPEDIVMTGSVDGSRYLLVESDRTDDCGQPVTGVELVEETENLIGSEWNTTGYQYGEYTDTRCGYVNDTSRYLENPALFNDSGAEVGDSFVWVYAVHPEIDAVRITAGDYTKDLRIYQVDGAGFAAFEIPKDLDEYTSELLIDGRVVPGSEEVREVPRPR
jgi:hypothetical protein